MKRAVVIQAHQRSYENPLAGSDGMPLQVIRADDRYRGWLWCRAGDGREGWVPAQYLNRNSGPAALNCEYNALELTVTEGAEVAIAAEESGWCLCLLDSGIQGWLPTDKLRILS